MEQFSLDKYLENPSRKVVTRDGREVEIFYYNADKTLLVGRISPTEIHQYTEDGFQYDIINEAKNDLFFADEEEELTEFEKALDVFAHNSKLEASNPNYYDWLLKSTALKLLDLAKKELQPEFDKELDKAYKTRDEVVYLEGYDKGHEDALKSLPKWKKATECKEFKVHVCVMNENMHPFLDTEVNRGEYYIELDDLKTLPKEE